MAGGCFTGAAPSRRGSWGSLLQHQPGQPCSQEAQCHTTLGPHIVSEGWLWLWSGTCSHMLAKAWGVFSSYTRVDLEQLSASWDLRSGAFLFIAQEDGGCSSCSLFLVAHHQLPCLVPQQEPLCSCMRGSQSTPCEAPQHHRMTNSWWDV